MNLCFVRFGEIPENEKSGIYNGDCGKIGEEKGVSVYEAIYKSGVYYILVPQIKSCSSQFTFEYIIQDIEEQKRKIYLVEGDIIGYGSEKEPLLKNVIIKDELILLDGKIKNKEPKPTHKIPLWYLKTKKYNISKEIYKWPR